MEKSISIKLILDRILDHPLLQDVTLERAIDYTIEFIRIVGSPTIFEEKVCTIELSNYRALLPCDFHQMIQCRYLDNNYPSFRYSTDSFHNGNSDHQTDYTYKIQGNIIIFSIKDGSVELAYQCIGTDSDGYPLIPDNSSFSRALELYIKKKRFTILYDLGKISGPVLQNVQTEYAWAVGNCQNDMIKLTLDKAESFYNSLKTLIIRDNEHKRGFINNGSKEYLSRN